MSYGRASVVADTMRDDRNRITSAQGAAVPGLQSDAARCMAPRMTLVASSMPIYPRWRYEAAFV